MDYDSSSKFISSLAKFLQSLCNGYVEFDSGVQVIGHIYLSVDTGKTIDYILNEKVCKTDENSVTFISNSFHAQPAEKPKPPGKRPKDVDKGELENDSSGDIEPRSTNTGTVPSRNVGQNSPLSQSGKRPYSPSKSGRSSPRLKKSRRDSLDISSQASNPANENSISSAPSESGDGGPLDSLSAQDADVLHGSQYNESYQQSFLHPDDENSIAAESEERDIKPSIDTDVTFIKEEYVPSSSCSQTGSQSRDKTRNDEYPYSNPAYPGGFAAQGGFVASGSGSQRSGFNVSGDRSQMFSPGQGSSLTDGGESSGDPSAIIDTILKQEEESSARLRTSDDSSSKPSVLKDFTGNALYRRYQLSSYLPKFLHQKRYSCSKCNQSFTYPGNLSRHKKACEGNFDIKCMYCEKVFYRQDVLKMHMRSKHGIISL